MSEIKKYYYIVYFMLRCQNFSIHLTPGEVYVSKSRVWRSAGVLTTTCHTLVFLQRRLNAMEF